MPEMDDKWQAEDDMRTMMRAEEIKADAERMKKVHKLAGRHKKAIRSIEDLKRVANNFSAEKESAAEDKAEGGKEE